MRKAPHILVIEDERKMSDIIVRGLRAEGYLTSTAADAEIGLQRARARAFDLVILDLLLPDLPGIHVLRQLREEQPSLPVLIVTARNEIEAKAENFEAGADDYLTKPFAFAELMMRVRALLRRAPVARDAVLKIADLELDREAHQVRRAGRRVELSPKEFGVLEYLMLSQGRALSRSMIIDRVWGPSFEGLTTIVDVYVGQVRRKVDGDSDAKLIRTVRGLGYAIDPQGTL